MGKIFHHEARKFKLITKCEFYGFEHVRETLSNILQSNLHKGSSTVKSIFKRLEIVFRVQTVFILYQRYLFLAGTNYQPKGKSV